MQAGQFVARHGKEAERIVVAQVQLGHEGKFGQIGQGLQIVWMHALVIKGFLVGWHVVIGMA